MQKIIEQLEQGFQIIHINDFEKSYDPADSDKAEYAENQLLIYSPKWNGARRPMQVYKGDQVQWTFLKSSQISFK